MRLVAVSLLVPLLALAQTAQEPAPAGTDAAPPAESPTPPPPEAPPAPSVRTPAATPRPTATPVPTPPPGTIRGKVTVDSKDGPRPGSSAVVYIENADPAIWGASSGRARGRARTPEVKMQNKAFAPGVVTVLAGEEIRFPNVDPVFHNVFSLSGKNKFDLGLYKDGASKNKTFTAPGVVRLFCNIHPAMKAFVVVLQNPWFADPSEDGGYRIAGVAPGSYTLKVWDERGGEQKREIKVEAGQTVTADFALDGSRFKEIPHKNKFGQDYSKDGY
jgi:plastocyanin